MKYKFGDIVKIKEDLEKKEYYMEDKCNSQFATDNMIEYKGKIATIMTAQKEGYLTNINNLWWSDEMLEDYNFPFVITLLNNANECKICKATEKCEAFKKMYNGETLCGLLDLVNKL